jgi:hypothetical protein
MWRSGGLTYDGEEQSLYLRVQDMVYTTAFIKIDCWNIPSRFVALIFTWGSIPYSGKNLLSSPKRQDRL